MRANSVLVRWQDGWQLVRSLAEYPPLEICQGQAGDGGEVLVKALSEVSTYRHGQTELTVGIDPLPTDLIAGIDWKEGDTVTVAAEGDLEVQAITFTMSDDTGKITEVPQFGVVLDSSVDRIARSIGAIGGLAGGTPRTPRPIATLTNPNVRPDPTG